MESITTQRIPYSEIRKMFDAAKKLEDDGRRVIHLEIGRPDFDTPEHIKEAAIEALRAGKVHYAANAGVFELRQAIAQKYEKRYGLKYDVGSDVLVTNGVAEGIYLAVHALLNPGDQILIPDPTWINYNIVPLAHFVEPVNYSLKVENNFLPDLDEIEDKITSRTKMIALISPSNPSGSVIPKEMAQRLADIIHKYNLLVLSDEIYEDIVYAPAQHTCMATLEGMQDRTIILNGFSKFYSMTGWRLGYALGPKKLINSMLRLHQYMLTSTNTFAQWGAIAALNGDQGPSHEMFCQFQKRRNFIYDAINGIPKLSCIKPDGAFYLFVSVKDTGLNGYQMSSLLLEKAGVVTVAGESFGKNGKGYVRISFASSMENLKEAALRVSKLIKEI